MAQAGYVLVSRKVPIAGRQNENGSDFADFYVDRLGLDGSHLEVARATGIEMLSCDGGTSSSAMPGRIEVVANYNSPMEASPMTCTCSRPAGCF